MLFLPEFVVSRPNHFVRFNAGQVMIATVGGAVAAIGVLHHFRRLAAEDAATTIPLQR